MYGTPHHKVQYARDKGYYSALVSITTAKKTTHLGAVLIN
ncbi:hypothetical protein MIDIC_230044 [Alphaproteobacteria bacterium]